MAATLAAARGAAVSDFGATDALLAIAVSGCQRVISGPPTFEAVPFADDLFDVVTGFNAFQVAGDPVRALSEALRMAQVVGRLVVMTWGGPGRKDIRGGKKCRGKMLG